MMTILLLLSVVNIHALWTYELLPNNQCGIDAERRDFETVAWPWITAIMNVYLPIVVSVTLAVILVVTSGRYVGTSATATALEHPDVDDARLLWVCVGVSFVYVAVTFPAVVLNLIEYFLPGWRACAATKKSRTKTSARPNKTNATTFLVTSVSRVRPRRSRHFSTST